MRLINLFTLLLATAACSNVICAQEKVVQKMEFEFRGGLTTPIGAYHDGSSQTGAALGLECRYNFKGRPWDCGLMFEVTTARRGFDSQYNKDADIWQSNRTYSLAATGSYNFRQGKNVNPFAGVAIGFAGNDVVGDEVYPSKGTSLLFAPRVGVELLHHLRLSLSSNVSRKGYNNLQFSLGFVIGGRPKKQ